MLINYKSMEVHKSIVNYGQLMQKQIIDLLACAELRGRLTLGPTQDFQYQQLCCIVPRTTSSFSHNNLTTIKIIIRFYKQNPNTIQQLFIQSQQIPQQIWYLNITESVKNLQKNVTIKQILIKILKQIDNVGIVRWGKCIYQYHFFNNKKQNNQNNQVNQITYKKNINKLVINQNQQKQENIVDIFNKQVNNIVYQSIQNRQNISTSFNKQITNNQLNKLQNIIGFNEENQQKNQNYLQMDIQKTNLQYSKNGENEPTQKKQEFICDAYQSLIFSPFSCFKPINHVISRQIKSTHSEFVKSEAFSNNQKEQEINLGFTKFIGSGFVPVKVPYKNSSFTGLNVSNDAQSMGSCYDSNKKTKGQKYPKPMNKNANLPKFLIRIFIKYVDKFKNMYAKKQFDKLYLQCKKMREWKKNDRRQHAFGLKHLKTFFQQFIEGFPYPALNRKVISKIIDNYLLQEICQNSQIPQTHRVGYLVACRVYSIRCRNASLAGRIQSK